MLKLSERNFRAAIIKLLQKIITNSLETNEKIENPSKKHKLYIFKNEQIGHSETM